MNSNHIALSLLIAGLLFLGTVVPASADKIVIIEDGRGDHGHRHSPPGHSKKWKKHRRDRDCGYREVHHYYRDDRHDAHRPHRDRNDDRGTAFGFWVTGLK